MGRRGSRPTTLPTQATSIQCVFEDVLQPFSRTAGIEQILKNNAKRAEEAGKSGDKRGGGRRRILVEEGRLPRVQEAERVERSKHQNS